MAETYSILMPADLMPPDSVKPLIARAVEEVEALAVSRLKGARVTVRDLLPSDLGLTNDVWYETTGATANQWENSDVADKEIADNTFVCIWGLTVLSDEPSVSAVKLKVSNAVKAIWALDKLVPRDVKVGIADSPIIITQNMKVTIQHYVKTANAGIEIAFDGCVVEKEGLKINAP